VNRSGDLDIQIDVPASAPDSADSVIVVNCDSEIACDPARLLSPTQENALRAFDAELHGKTMRFGPGKKTDAYVIQWSKPDETISWNVRVTQPTTFNVATLYDAASAGGMYAVKIGSQSLSGT